ncbi:gluconeogenesis factor YvcK family protein [Aerococcus sanguinicola]|uniref:Putative gluconeogenesis factor n=1 Tax=Aerococcus sanguinicola TaxID=119206 RepID=A0A0X8FBJ5_9LACT|nr:MULTISPECIES: uridine diphosphate-N-acetylglucosamine-binding protein YvcK [Aerococcus]AMB94308.1 hypothetical protein AWM72_05815 [Aerococcus sanguinicola]MDK7049909.1 uridine diphosphate-N-acetylglucosamine-binding protein YvcK [Aerococcus sanguinicola]OFT92601.1 hypothetical protein HMPREF3090_08280 [Aerococcus sp. HMSC23C02]PKZ22486.1 hypothetical protein CYJ28_05050 [Aerococcus sanguinicola]
MINRDLLNQAKNDKLKITVIGGGTGLPILLSGLKQANCEITAVVTVSDNGGSSGSIRTSLNTIPPGDIRNCIVALSEVEQIYKDIFQYRFAPEDQEFSGHAIGNLIIAALAEMRGDVFSSLRLLSAMMKVKGRVLPAAEEPLVLRAHYNDGQTIDGETEIVGQRRPIDRVSVHCMPGSPCQDRKPQAGRQVVSAIREADLIVLGPGSLYTSILPNLVIEDIRQAVLESPAKVVYICNIMTQLGETEHFSDADHVRVINDHLQAKRIDYALINKAPVPYEYMESDLTPEYLVQVERDRAGILQEEAQIVAADFLDLRETGVYHDQDKLVETILRLYEADKGFE